MAPNPIARPALTCARRSLVIARRDIALGWHRSVGQCLCSQGLVRGLAIEWDPEVEVTIDRRQVDHPILLSIESTTRSSGQLQTRHD